MAVLDNIQQITEYNILIRAKLTEIGTEIPEQRLLIDEAWEKTNDFEEHMKVVREAFDG